MILKRIDQFFTGITYTAYAISIIVTITAILIQNGIIKSIPYIY